MPKSTKTIVIMGAKGRVSHEVALAFDRAGYNVVATSRDGETIEGLDTLEHRAIDAMNGADLIEGTADADIVFNGLNPPYTAWKSKAMPMAKNILDACAASDALHLFPGNIYGFGEQLPLVLTEQTPLSGAHKKAVIRNEMEALFRDRSGEVQTINLRAGDFFGGSRGGSWFDLLIAAKLDKGKFTYPGKSDIAHAWAYLPDLARAFVMAAEHADSLSRFECIHFSGHTITGEEMKAATEQVLGRPIKLSHLPLHLFSIGGLVIPMWREIAEVSYQWRKEHRLSGEMFEQKIGTTPRTALNAALRGALRDLGFAVP